MLWFTLAATIAGATPLPPIVADFQSICGNNDQAPQAILAEAKREGWTARAPGSAGAADPHTQRLMHATPDGLELILTTNHSAGETRQTCGLKSTSAAPGIVQAAQEALGFKPALDMGSAATFFAIRTGAVWRSAYRLPPAEIGAAKAAGRFYTIMAHSDVDGASLYAVHVTATTAP